jgi:hypothetical protein
MVLRKILQMDNISLKVGDTYVIIIVGSSNSSL